MLCGSLHGVAGRADARLAANTAHQRQPGQCAHFLLIGLACFFAAVVVLLLRMRDRVGEPVSRTKRTVHFIGWPHACVYMLNHACGYVMRIRDVMYNVHCT